jgi:L-alanine-DL-glutamate epimerase-like enolase superfamily enzyme
MLESMKTVSIETLDEIDGADFDAASGLALSTVVLHKLSADKSVYPWALLGVSEPPPVRTSYTVSIDSPENMYDEIIASEYPIIKIKMGFAEDEQLLEMLKDVGGKIFRVDANGGWTPDKAERMVYSLSKLRVEFIEQPTDVEHVTEWKHIKGRTGMNLFIDEGLRTLEDYGRYSDYVDGINIKLAKSGGIMEALRLARRAGREKRQVMFGCMLESSVAISQAVYLASLAGYFDLDAPLLLDEDIAEGISYEREEVTVDETIMGGPKIKEQFLHG